VNAGHAAGRIQELAGAMRRPGVVRKITWTAASNVMLTAAAGLGGIILARAAGPVIRGEYAGVTAWFGVALVIGSLGQPAALCFYVAAEPERASSYLATSRAMMLSAGILAAPLLAHGNASVATGYRIAFSASIVGFVGASYTFSLQATDLRRWNQVRLSQPLLSLVAVAALWGMRLLDLDAALAVLAGTTALQFIWAHHSCRRVGLVPGRASSALVRPLAGYGAAQIAALTPATLNAQLDKLVLSQMVPAAALGQYAVAVSISLLPAPLVTAIGYVAFPHLASRGLAETAAHRLTRAAILSSMLLAAGVLIPLAVLAHWLVPLVLGDAYRAAVPLLWVLTPGAIVLASSQVAGDLLRGRKRPAAVAWAEGSAAIFTLALLVALVPALGVYGAAIASTVAYGVAFAVLLGFLRRPRPSGQPAPTGLPG